MCQSAVSVLFSTARRPCRTCCAGSTAGCWLLQGTLCLYALVLCRRDDAGWALSWPSSPGSSFGQRPASHGAGSRQRANAVCGAAVPMVERAPEEPPPFVVLVQGPPGVGKSTLIRCLVKHCTRQALSEVKGPVTVVAGKTRRLTFVECPQARQSPF